ncbi:MAG TPA: class I SAM-dependent methyltransferase [Planctomycetaceae bacterium]|nr:class I SAM-dependent methyltransferase [Planctomycetaceae bacterium]
MDTHNHAPSVEAAQNLNHLYGDLGDQEQDFRNGNLIRLVESYVQGKDVLDIGCGSGRLLTRLMQDGFAPQGIEPDPELRKLAARMTPDLKILAGGGERVGEFRDAFDTITIIDVLEHIEDDNQQLELMFQALQPGGRLVVVVPAHGWLYGKRDQNVGHYRRYSRKMLLDRVRAAGFEIESSRFWNMLGVAPYWFSERILKQELNTSLRTGQPKGFFKRTVAGLLRVWFRQVENRFSFGFGLSVICLAVKPLPAANAQAEAA